MTTSFSTLPIIDLSSLRLGTGYSLSQETATKLSHQLYDTFATTGFAYLTNPPISFSHKNVFDLCRQFFSIPEGEKQRIAKHSFNKANRNTYRGYFPTQPLLASDNLKEGFEQGPAGPLPASEEGVKIDLAESNVWPDPEGFPSRADLEQLHAEMQDLSAKLLSLLASSLDKPSTYFEDYLTDSISTLRLLHYPVSGSLKNGSSETLGSTTSVTSHASEDNVRLACTPHTDSGILTLLHQDPTGGLEVQNAAGQWIPAPYIPGSIVVNIGDLMAEVSGGRFVATMHRVRAPQAKSESQMDRSEHRFGRFSVPFFFEPGEKCVVRSVDDQDGPGIVYGDHVRAKMRTWVEFQDSDDEK